MSEPEPKISVTRSCEICGFEVTLNHIAGLKKKKFKCSNCVEVRPSSFSKPSEIIIGITLNSLILIFFQIENTTNNFGNSGTNTSGNASGANSTTGTKPGHHPVKKRGLPCVTKCQQCNGSGIIFIGGSKNHKINNSEKTFTCNICDGTFSR